LPFWPLMTLDLDKGSNCLVLRLCPITPYLNLPYLTLPYHTKCKYHLPRSTVDTGQSEEENEHCHNLARPINSAAWRHSSQCLHVCVIALRIFRAFVASSWMISACLHVCPCLSRALKNLSWHENKTNEKALRETQTLRAGCNKTEPKNFAPPQTPFPGARDGQNLISWRWSLPLPTNPV